MRAVIAGGGSPYRGDVRRRLELTKDMVRKALPRLSATAEIEALDGKHVVVDPLLANRIERINQGASEAEQSLS
jgi:DNA-binding GntR family transcriptional regulator